MSNSVVRFKTDIGFRSWGINILPFDYEIPFDGSEIPLLDFEALLYNGKYIYKDNSYNFNS